MTQAALDTIPEAPIAFVDLQAQRRRLGTRIDDAIGRVLDHGRFIMGPEVAELEARLATHCGAEHVIGCSSGTDGLVLGLMALGVGPGDAVFVPSFTFAATAEAVALVGATPVFVDILPDSFNLDPASLTAAIESIQADQAYRPAGVIPVDLFGQPADYRAIEPVAVAHGLWVMADAAQSYGALLDNRRIGTIGRVAVTSFFPAKPLGCYGDGGAIFTDDGDLAAILRSLLSHGKGSEKYDNVRIGMNGRLDTIQAAILLEKIGIFDDEVRLRQQVAARYDSGLRDIVEVPALVEGATSVWAQYTLVLDDRDVVAAKLKERGIPTAIYYPRPLHRQTAYQDFPMAPGGLPVSEELSGRVLSLPMHPYLEAATQDRIIASVRAAVG
ncbi:MAG: DegT/DnrJ/EryC1/StrS aminotransferase family protein [Proteobacteria bacterium]|nr:DegT/DnrJ/EryC1/StrS aminotransferase family protein [Pseudomonadota bacterium]